MQEAARSARKVPSREEPSGQGVLRQQSSGPQHSWAALCATGELRASRRPLKDVEGPSLWKNMLLVPIVVTLVTEHETVPALKSIITNNSVNSY